MFNIFKFLYLEFNKVLTFITIEQIYLLLFIFLHCKYNVNKLKLLYVDVVDETFLIYLGI